jgi:hypothetical protein
MTSIEKNQNSKKSWASPHGRHPGQSVAPFKVIEAWLLEADVATLSTVHPSILSVSSTLLVAINNTG